METADKRKQIVTYSLSEAAEILDISESQIKVLISKGAFKVKNMSSGNMRIDKKSFDEYVIDTYTKIEEKIIRDINKSVKDTKEDSLFDE